MGTRVLIFCLGEQKSLQTLKFTKKTKMNSETNLCLSNSETNQTEKTKVITFKAESHIQIRIVDRRV